MSNPNARKIPTSIALDDELKNQIDEYARAIFGQSDCPRSRSAAVRVLVRLGLSDPRRLQLVK